MPANTTVDTEIHTMDELEAALELSSDDPDAVLPARLQGALRKAAVTGVAIGLEWGGPVLMDGAKLTTQSLHPTSALEAGSVSHDGFVH